MENLACGADRTQLGTFDALTMPFVIVRGGVVEEKMFAWKKFALASAVTLFINPANATLIVNTGNIPGLTDNVISNACVGGSNGPSLAITGCLNTNHSQVVQFNANENIQYDAGGQAVITASDGLGFNYLNVSV